MELYKIISKDRLAEKVTRLVIYAPDVARNATAGQFVVIIASEKGERIPLTVADIDKAKGVITIIFQEVGFSTKELGLLNTGDCVYALLGPLGNRKEIKKVGKVICVGGGVGIAEIFPIARAYKKEDNHVICIIGARTRDLLILQDELKSVCDELLITTDDGSFGVKGFVTDVLNFKLQEADCNLVYAVGPVIMMKKVSELTRQKNIKTMVSLNPIMVDATGMCGVCRCKVAGKTVFGCVDGPEFDAHQVDFDELSGRLAFFKEEENHGRHT